ncbi:hypothetical protein [Gemmobacter denitrificans]|uniref:Uncharacterized protein n=1 Tax=Gemmobacter denitrificans TaxID=3123040 RepID=A0ABU8BWM5_9RHOB
MFEGVIDTRTAWAAQPIAAPVDQLSPAERLRLAATIVEGVGYALAGDAKTIRVARLLLIADELEKLAANTE